MQRQNLRAKAAREYKATTDSKHDLPAAAKLPARNFSAGAPKQKWASDIRYLWTGGGWLYLAVLIALHSRLVWAGRLQDAWALILLAGPADGAVAAGKV